MVFYNKTYLWTTAQQTTQTNQKRNRHTYTPVRRVTLSTNQWSPCRQHTMAVHNTQRASKHTMFHNIPYHHPPQQNSNGMRLRAIYDHSTPQYIVHRRAAKYHTGNLDAFRGIRRTLYWWSVKNILEHIAVAVEPPWHSIYPPMGIPGDACLMRSSGVVTFSPSEPDILSRWTKYVWATNNGVSGH